MHCRKIECDILLYLGKKPLKLTYLENGCIIMRMCPSMPFLRLFILCAGRELGYSVLHRDTCGIFPSHSFKKVEQS